MAGKKGCGGRPRLSAAEHLLRGTFRPDRHGPKPGDVQPVRTLASVTRRQPTAPALAQPVAWLTVDDCPVELSAAARALWATLIHERPVERLYAQLLATYCEAVAQWTRSTAAIGAIGDLIRVGQKPALNPHHQLRREAEKTMLDAARYLGWQPTVATADRTTTAAPSRLKQFLDAKARRRR